MLLIESTNDARVLWRHADRLRSSCDSACGRYRRVIDLMFEVDVWSICRTDARRTPWYQFDGPLHGSINKTLHLNDVFHFSLCTFLKAALHDADIRNWNHNWNRYENRQRLLHAMISFWPIDTVKQGAHALSKPCANSDDFHNDFSLRKIDTVKHAWSCRFSLRKSASWNASFTRYRLTLFSLYRYDTLPLKNSLQHFLHVYMSVDIAQSPLDLYFCCIQVRTQ